ncbi:MAG: hypothetical protein ACIAQZ_15670 [Sedimentisphaeraceae bacterium JB056]
MRFKTLILSALVIARISLAQPMTDAGGAKAFNINGQPEAPIFLFQQEINVNDGPRFAQAGFKLYSSIEINHFLDLDWERDGFDDKGMLNKVMMYFNARMPQDCYLMPRIHVWAPTWWLIDNPNECVEYMIPPDDAVSPADSTYAPGNAAIHESFASEKWKNEAGEILRQAVRFLLEKYPNRVKAIHIANGMWGEWHRYRAENIPDVSEPMLVYFRNYLKEKYNNDIEALRTSWNWPYVTFETAPFPTLEAMTTPTNGVFLNPTGNQVFDYYEAYHQSAVDAIDHFCQIVKDESNGELATCILYGYEPDMPYMSQQIDHRASAAAFRLNSVDMFASPHSYTDRFLGGHGMFRHYPDSVAANGKLFMDEADVRTHYANYIDPDYPCVYTTTIEEDLQVLNRAFGHILTQGTGGWYMDQSSGKWYDDPATTEYDPDNPILTNFDNIKKWADESLKFDRSRINNVAVITSQQSEFYIANTNPNSQLGANFALTLKRTLATAGAPFNNYLIEDLEEGLIPEHKVYIFLGCFYLTDSQRASIQNLKANNHTLVWIYAADYVQNHDFSETSMEQLIGIDFSINSDSFEEITVQNSIFPNAPTSFKGNSGQGIKTLSPRFVPESTGVLIWGKYSDGQPALISKNMGNWKSVYSATSGIPTEILRKIYTDAGVHVYSETNDVLNANDNWIMIHGTANHTNQIKLPRKSDVFDVINNAYIGKNISDFSIATTEGKTDIFLISSIADINKNGNIDIEDLSTLASEWLK